MEAPQNQAQEIKYYQQVTQCGKPHCKKCRSGAGHGPYWYAYRTVNGRTVRTYVGKVLPAEVQATLPTQAPPETGRVIHSPPNVAVPPARTRAEDAPAPEHAQETSTPVLRISVLGQFRVERREAASGTWQALTDSSLRHQRIRITLACLLSSPRRMIGREQLLDLLWADLDLEVAAARLDRVTYDLRWLFEPDRSRLTPSSLLLTSHEILALADQSLIWVDADAFEDLVGQVYESSDPEEKERLMEQALALYGGEYFPDVFLKAREGGEQHDQEFEEVNARRELLRRSWIGLMIDLADLRIARGALRAAITLLQQVVAADTTNEAAVQRLMKLFAQMGQRGEALRTYKRLASVLQREHHIVPLPQTRVIYEALHEESDTSRPEGMLSILPSSPLQGPASYTARTIVPFTAPIGRNHQSPLVGREEELRFLRSMLVEIEHVAKLKLQGQKKTITTFETVSVPQGVLLAGEIGIGKTRLAEEIAREAQQRGWSVVWNRMYAQDQTIPYRPWIEIVRQVIALELAGRPGGWLRQEIYKHPFIFQPLSTLLPELYEQLPAVTMPFPLLPEQEQMRLWEAIYELLVFVSDIVPLFIALDDIQWADSRSCELLAYLLRRLQGYPLVLLGTCRENELSSAHALYALRADLQREQALVPLSLPPLSDEQINALVLHITSHLFSGLADISASLAERVRTRVAGNPFFAEEFTRAVGLHLTTHAPGGRGGAMPSLPRLFQRALETSTEVALPDTIVAAIDLRLSQLSTRCQQLLSKAAVLGGSFEFQTIIALEATSPNVDEDAVLLLLEEALDANLLTEEGSGSQVTYQFWHPLLVSRLYEKLSAARRASLHRRAAAIMQKSYEGREEEGAATIIYHLVQGGGESQKIATFAELAANQAYALSSYSEAEYYYHLSLHHRPADPNIQLHRAALLEQMGECISSQGTGRYAEAREAYQQAFEIYKQAYPTLSAESPEALYQIVLWVEIGVTWYDQMELAQAGQIYEQIEQQLRTLGLTDNAAWAYLRFQQGYLAWISGDVEDALLKAQEALLRFETLLSTQQEHQPGPTLRLSRLRRTLIGHPMTLGRVYMLLGTIKVCMGKSDEGLSYYREAVAIYERYNCTRDQGIIWNNIGDSHLRRGEFVQAETALQRSLALTRTIGDLTQEGFAHGNLGLLAWRTGDLDTAIMQLKKAVELAERVQDKVGLSYWVLCIAAVLSEQGHHSEAGDILREAFTSNKLIRHSSYKAPALVILATFRLAQVRTSKQQERQRLLRIKNTLHRTLALPGIEAEPKAEAHSLLTETLLLLGEIDEAYEVASQALELAQAEIGWLIARVQRLQGTILAAQRRYKQARHVLQQSLQTAQARGMPQEYVQTKQTYQRIFQRKRQQDAQEHRPVRVEDR